MRRLNDEQTSALIERLIRGTRQRDFEWKAPSNEEHWFVEDSGRFAYAIASMDQDDRHPFELRIIANHDNPSGGTVLAEAISQQAELTEQTLVELAELYVAAKASALSLGEIFDDVLVDLDGRLSPF